jgi:hypothetical protein
MKDGIGISSDIQSLTGKGMELLTTETGEVIAIFQDGNLVANSPAYRGNDDA